MERRVQCVLCCLSIVLCMPVHGQGFGLTDGTPVMRALDVDGDGVLSRKEIANASAALQLLDEDGDGELSAEELGTRSRWAGMRMDDMGDWDRPRGGAAGTESRTRLNPAQVELEDGSATIADRKTFKEMAYREGMVMPHHEGLEFVKFQIEDHATDEPKLYFINTQDPPGAHR